MLVFAFLLSAIALPWNWAIDENSSSLVSGIPIGFAIAIFGLPLVVLFFLTTFVKSAEDVDRHDTDLENE